MRSLPITVYCCNCAKDNLRILTRALSSVNWCAQKIFISDSTTEESKALARGMGWEIFEWAGPNHMAERRNYAIGFEGNDTVKPYWTTHPIMSKVHPVVKNDLILQIDSDEVYEWDTYQVMKLMLNKEKVEDWNTFAFILKSVTPDGAPMSSLYLDRMWRKGNIYWNKSIQNNPVADDRIFIVPAIIYHYGYGDNETHQIKQWNRLVQNEEEARKEPGNMQNVMYLLNSLVICASGQPLAMDRMMGTFDAGIQIYENSPKGTYEKHCLEKLLRFLWSACTEPMQKRYYITAATRYYEDVKDHPDVTYRLYDACLSVGDLKNAVLCGERFIKMIHKFKPEQKESVMELTTAQETNEVLHHLVGMCKHLAKTEKDPQSRRFYERKYKYWSKK